ncbi:MAG: capsular polysaccharide synthesis protein [Rickettsiales bacterium]|jgi:mannosyltransferase OCH1-like enzyme|nr:capsular polysaccharide synthesis protein [Rickettsiales bacterium]
MRISKIRRFLVWFQIRIIGNLHFFNTKKRKRIRDKIKGRVLCKTLKRYVIAAENIPLTKSAKDDENEKIFALWFQGEKNAPPLVQSCWRSIRRNCPQKLIILDDKTLPDFINLPGYIIDKRRNGKIKTANFSDIARMELLHNHGGYWMDSTDFVTAPIPKFISDSDFFVFLTGPKICSYSFIQSCFIRSRKNTYLINALREVVFEYWKYEPKSIDYFTFHLLLRALVENNPIAAMEFTKMPHVNQDPTHRLWFQEGAADGHYWADKPFDRKKFDELTSGAFFQKLNFKDKNAQYPIPESFADVIIKM